MSPGRAAALFLCGIALASAAVPAAAQAQRPNIVVIETDDQTDASVSHMPWLRRLIGRPGVRFTNSFVSLPQCCPSRATLMTGQFAHNHRVLSNKPPWGGYTKLDKRNWLPVWLQRGGYRTIQLGRSFNRYGRDNPNKLEIPPGFDEWYVPLDPREYHWFDFTMNENGRLVRHAGPHQNDVYRSKVKSLIRRVAPSRRPFFLYLSYSAPHFGAQRFPGDPSELLTTEPAARHRNRFGHVRLPRPPNFNELDVSDKPQEIADLPLLPPNWAAAVQEGYQQELETLQSVDDGVRAIYRALARARELDDTLIVYTSDNGYLHGEHRVHAGKGFPYEASIRVPLLMRGPGVPRDRRLTQLVSNVDLAPTLLEAARIRPGRRQDGRSLWRFLRDPTLELGRPLLVESPVGDNKGGAYAGVRTYRYLFVEYRETGELELYDLKRDRYQLRSLDASPAYDLARAGLERQLRLMRRCAGTACNPKPRVRLAFAARRGPGGCVTGPLRVRVGGPDRGDLRLAELFVGRRRVAQDGRAPFLKRVGMARLPRSRRGKLRVRATTVDGRMVTVDRRVRRCL